jgi:tetratricopeptide (TPR) repeat protein
MKRQPISVFTPSNTDPEILERIFVQRHRLLEKIVDRLKRSMLSGDKHHVLLIGPRGSGKTNMVTLAHHRLTRQKKLKEAMRVAWLGEDDTITGLIDLALGIADRLAEAYPSEFDVDYRSLFRGLPPDDAGEAILAEIHQRLRHRSLLLIIENLDAAFKGMGDQGQKRWRAFLQEKGRVATLATAQQIFDAVSDRDFPFWGFFDIHHLAPLSFEDARTLIRNIAEENQNHELIRFLDTADGRYRIRSLHHLAGGNHRMYVLVSEFLTKESLDDLVAAFEILADQLTPYFQERLRSLPAQQARIVQCLAAVSGAATVKEIASLTFIDERSCSKQLGELRNKRYVQSEKRGKESYYELSEPLMRLCLEVKNQRGKPLQLIARFLKVWFTHDGLQKQLDSEIDAGNRVAAYLASALSLDTKFQIAVWETINREYENHLHEKNYDAALKVAEELQCVDKLLGVWKAARVNHERGDLAGELENYTAVIDFPDAPIELKAKALVNRGVTYYRAGETQKAIADYMAVIELPDAPIAQKAQALFGRGTTYSSHIETDKAIADYTAVIELPGVPIDQKGWALLVRGESYGSLGNTEKAISDYTAAIELPDAPVDQKAQALISRGVAYSRFSETEKAIADYTAVIELSGAPTDRKVSALCARGVTYSSLGERQRALSDCTAVIELPDSPVKAKAQALFIRGVSQWQMGQMREALKSLREVVHISSQGSEILCRAMFALPEPMIEVGLLDEVSAALRAAFVENGREFDRYGGTPQDLFWMVLRRGSGDWDKYVATLMPLYVEFQVADKLARGLTQLIERLDAADFSHKQLDEWNAVWQRHGAPVEELQIALKCLSAATEAIKTKSDRPLFQLPQEIRSLVRSLLCHSLGPVSES